LNPYKERSNITLNDDSCSLFFAPLGTVKMRPLRQLLFKAAIRRRLRILRFSSHHSIDASIKVILDHFSEAKAYSYSISAFSDYLRFSRVLHIYLAIQYAAISPFLRVLPEYAHRAAAQGPCRGQVLCCR
jgi:hypothetical protein